MPRAAAVLLEAVLEAAGGLPARAAGGPPARAAGGPPARVAVVGIAKNAGKTVTLNHLAAVAAARGIPVGLVSAGRDGEARDAVTHLPKPPVQVTPGMWIATAHGVLERASAGLQVVGTVPDSETRLGPLVIARVTAAGTAELTGPGSARRLRTALDHLESARQASCLRPGLTLVDGALDRIAAAAPAVTGALVLAVGASYHPSLRATLARARSVLELAALPQVDPGRRPGLCQALAAAPVTWLSPSGEPIPLPFRSALDSPEALAAAVEGYAGAAAPDEDVGTAAPTEHAAAAPPPFLAVSGAVTGTLLQALIRRPATARAVALAVPDLTHVLADDHTWRRYRRLGGRVFVARAVRVAAVTTNPWTPASTTDPVRAGPGPPGAPPAEPGHGARELAAAVAEFAGTVPVVDVVADIVLRRTAT